MVSLAGSVGMMKKTQTDSDGKNMEEDCRQRHRPLFEKKSFQTWATIDGRTLILFMKCVCPAQQNLRMSDPSFQWQSSHKPGPQFVDKNILVQSAHSATRHHGRKKGHGIIAIVLHLRID
jgi:hypothetical protein